MAQITTDKDLDELERQLGLYNVNALDSLKGLPFYDWSAEASSIKSHAQTPSFNHAIGLPQKNGQPMPLFDYEQLLYNELQSNKHLWIKKATGLGVTEFMLRYMAWLCFNNNGSASRSANDSKNVLSDSQMCIVTGPRIELAITLIDRMKRLFSEFQSYQNHSQLLKFDTKETVIKLNGVHIEAYPSHHLDSMRGLTDVSFIYLDEADFFPPGQQQDARDVSERYIGKSNPHIVMVSTPNAPDGLFERIEKEPESTCLYRRLFLDYTYGLGRIYTQEEIDNAKQSPSFEREYNLKYLGLIGNVFHTKDIEAAIEKGKKLLRFGDNVSTSANSYTKKSVGLDPGFGSSNFGVCITSVVDGIVNVLHAEEYHRPDFNEMINITSSLIDKYDISFQGGSRIFTDGSNPAFVRALKTRVREDTDYEQAIITIKKNTPGQIESAAIRNNMFVIPIAFGKYHKEMLAHSKEIMENNNGMIAIHPDNGKLITALRTAVENGEGSLDKDATSYDDLFDAFRMSLLFWH